MQMYNKTAKNAIFSYFYALKTARNGENHTAV